MGYTAIDLIDKCIDIEKLVYKIYIDFSKETGDTKLKTMAKILAKEELRHIDIFSDFKKQFTESNIEIDFKVFDMASKLIYQFRKEIELIDADEVNGLLSYALNIENSNVALLVSIKDELVKSSELLRPDTIDVLDALVAEERKHVKNLKAFLHK